MNDDIFGDWIDDFLSEENEQEDLFFDDIEQAEFADDKGVNGYDL